MNRVKAISMTFFVAALVAALVLAGCSSKKQVSSSTGEAQPAGSQAAESGGTADSAKPIEAKSLPKHPLTMKLFAGEIEGGKLELVVRVEINGKLPSDPVLKIHLPEGVELETGLAEEALALSGGSEVIERRFVVPNTTPSARFTVDAAGPGAGAHAEAGWPEAEPAEPAKMPETISISPVKLHGVTLDKAIPVKPKKKPAEQDQ
ncbi:MAG: hypothetical protein ABIJ56_22475 [Pseudomonadota bacterium]